MRKFNVWNLAMLLHHIDHSLEAIKPMATDVELRDEKLNEEQVKMWISGELLMAESIAREIHLEFTLDRVWAGGGPFWMAAKTGFLTWQEAYSQLRFLREAIEADLEKSTFVFVPRRKAELLDGMGDDWKTVWTALPDAKQDIEKAVECLALEEETASVFHMMRAVEWGLRAFCRHLKLLTTKKMRASGTVKLTPIAYSTWEEILGDLRPKVNARLSQIKRGPKRQKLQEFYNPVLADVEAFKDAWRNHVMHSRREYTAEDALSILSHVRRFMNLLASNGVTKV